MEALFVQQIEIYKYTLFFLSFCNVYLCIHQKKHYRTKHIHIRRCLKHLNPYGRRYVTTLITSFVMA
jgi:hypothetical protein